VAWAEVYFRTKWRLHPSSCLTSIDMGQKLGRRAPPPFCGGELGPHLTQSRLGRGLLHTKWHLNPSSNLAITEWAKNWAAVLLWGRGAGSASNTMWPGPRATCGPSFILIHPIVWPQHTNVTDRHRQDRTDNGLIA